MANYRLRQTGQEVQDLLDKVEGIEIENGTITVGEESITPVTEETDPTVPAWAKESAKPDYSLAELQDDATHRTVTDVEKATWNGKQNAIADLDDIRSGAGAGASAVQPSQMQTALEAKQDLLVSGQNIKTINGESLLGSGDLEIGGGGGVPEIFIAEYDVTSYQDIFDAYAAGKIPFVVYDTMLYTPYICDEEGGSFAFCSVDAESHVVDVVYVFEEGWDEAEYDIYSMPDGGIPETDLSSAVTAKLNKMDVFWAEPNATTHAELVAAANADKIIIAYRGNGFYSLTDFNSAGFWFYHINVETGYVSGYRVTQSNGWEQLDDFVIPSTTSIDEWDAKYDKPSGGIPASDIAAGVIPDVSQFITKSVNDLVNYYTKSQTYTKTEVQNLIGAIQQFHYEIVATLPATGESNVLYLLGPTGTGADKYEEYVYANSTWTKIGDTSIDLSQYVTTTALNTALADYTTTANLTTLLAGKQDTINDLADIRSGAAAGATAYQKPSGGIPKSDLASAVQTSLGKADTALQSFTETDPIFLASPAHGITSSDITAWNAKYDKPSTGIPASDLASGVIPTIESLTTSEIDTLWANN